MRKLELVREKKEIKQADKVIAVEERDDAVMFYQMIRQVSYKDKEINDQVRPILKVKKKLLDAIEGDSEFIVIDESERKALETIYDYVKKAQETIIPLGLAEAMIQLEDSEVVKSDDS